MVARGLCGCPEMCRGFLPGRRGAVTNSRTCVHVSSNRGCLDRVCRALWGLCVQPKRGGGRREGGSWGVLCGFVRFGEKAQACALSLFLGCFFVFFGVLGVLGVLGGKDAFCLSSRSSRPGRLLAFASGSILFRVCSVCRIRCGFLLWCGMSAREQFWMRIRPARHPGTRARRTRRTRDTLPATPRPRRGLPACGSAPSPTPAPRPPS